MFRTRWKIFWIFQVYICSLHLRAIPTSLDISRSAGSYLRYNGRISDILYLAPYFPSTKNGASAETTYVARSRGRPGARGSAVLHGTHTPETLPTTIRIRGTRCSVRMSRSHRSRRASRFLLQTRHIRSSKRGSSSPVARFFSTSRIPRIG